MPTLRYCSPGPHEITRTVTEQLQAARTLGWYESLHNTRTLADINYWLGGQDKTRLQQLRRNLKKAAHRGHLALAINHDSAVVGYAIGTNEVSPLPGSGEAVRESLAAFGVRAAKWAHHLLRPYTHNDKPSKVYAKLWNVAVDPHYWGEEGGAHLAYRVYSGFREDQIPTAYVFEEDTKAMYETPRWGYHLEPPDQEPTPKDSYFGPARPPVLQYRFAADSVGQLRASLQAYIQARS